MRLVGAAAIAVVCWAGTAQAQGPWNVGADGANVTATLSGGTLTVSGEGNMMNQTNHETFPWENMREAITSVIIEDGVTGIGVAAFNGFVNLVSVTIGNSVRDIGDHSFAHCSSLTSVTIPNNVWTIGIRAFADCANLASVTIGDSVAMIGISAFQSTALTSINIPQGVAIIHDNAFGACDALTAINVEPDNSLYYSVDGVLFRKHADILLHYPANKPATSYTIPNGVTSIENNAFAGCSNLTSVIIPDGVTEIGDYAFAGCAALTSVTIPNSVTDIGMGAFSNTGLTSVTIPNGMTSIKSHTFQDAAALASVTIPSSVEHVGPYSFAGTTGLASVTIPNGVTGIENHAFAGSGLTSLSIGADVVHIGWNAFAGCYNLTSVDVDHANIRYSSIDGVLFRVRDEIDGGDEEGWLVLYPASKANTSYTIPDGVTGIEDGAFDGVVNLSTLTVPSSVAHVGDSQPGMSGSFGKVGSLASIILLSPTPPGMGWGWNEEYDYTVFFSTVCIYVPEGTVEIYRDSDWGRFECIKPVSEYVSIATSDREIPRPGGSEEASVIAPVIISSGEFTVGPNPVSRLSGIMNFYWNGRRVNDGVLTVFDASGNVVGRVGIKDINDNNSRRVVGSWDLTDDRGRIVSEGTYLVRGMITTLGGNRERVSVLIGVR
jgi:hypothetical protein